MDSASSNTATALDAVTKVAFLDHLDQHRSNRRVSPAERALMIEWLTNTSRTPGSQKESSRRNYVRRTFSWNNESQTLVALGQNGENSRVVVTEESIADVVEAVHIQNNHLGWDATWKDVSASYYRIMRSDVTFLLKRCIICAYNPSKRAKNPRNEDFFNPSNQEAEDPENFWRE